MGIRVVASPINEALPGLLIRLDTVDVEEVHGKDLHSLYGRALAQSVHLDHDSPGCNLSAMDGYAVRLRELLDGSVPIVGECRIGSPPETLELGTSRRIYTGGPIPDGADTVVRLERAVAQADQLTLISNSPINKGADIRRQGENAVSGTEVLIKGQQLTPAAISALATISPDSISAYCPLRIAVITTGDELHQGPGNLPPWRLRDSNGPTLQAMLAPMPWIQSIERVHSVDDLKGLTDAIRRAVEQADAVVLTGGVSKGAYDFVPAAIADAGGEVVFHRVAARPGQPTLGAIHSGRPVLGLPGNPLSVMCAGRRLLVPALRKRAGFADAEPAVPLVSLQSGSEKSLPITWWRPVKLVANGVAELASLKGSGDVIGPADTDGFVEIPPERTGVGPFAYFAWQP